MYSIIIPFHLEDTQTQTLCKISINLKKLKVYLKLNLHLYSTQDKIKNNFKIYFWKSETSKHTDKN